MIVILELCKGEEIIPVVLPLINEEAEELFRLINPFCLSISLRVICSGSSQLDSESKELVQFLHEFHYELGSSI